MKSNLIEFNNLQELNQRELRNVNGGIIMMIVGHAIVVAYVCAMFEAGRAAAN